MAQSLQILGAVMVLAGFAGTQFKLLDQRSYPYLLLNLIGSAIVAILAFAERQWGFLLLSCWKASAHSSPCGVSSCVSVTGSRLLPSNGQPPRCPPDRDEERGCLFAVSRPPPGR